VPVELRRDRATLDRGADGNRDRARTPMPWDLETTILADPFLEPMVEYINELGWDVYSFDHEGVTASTSSTSATPTPSRWPTG
jgi:hypothetical protein